LSPANFTNQYTEHFVKFFGWYEASGFLHIAMEYCEYGDLKGYLSDNKTMPENQVQDIALQVTGALSLMHGERFAHRDLKPAVSKPTKANTGMSSYSDRIS
jgi:serine/threonine protein kinase